MAEIVFTYNGVPSIVQCYENDNFTDILSKLTAKIKINLNKVYFLYSGQIMQNKHQTFSQIANNLDKERKKMNIQINDSEVDIPESAIVKPKQLICPECQKSCLISIIDYRIRLYDCINGHDTDCISLECFEDTQKIDESKIKCDDCKEVDKSNAYQKSFYRCNTCKINLCPLCKNKHDQNHYLINYDEINYICPKHNYPYALYCKSCKKNACISCEIEHNHHDIISYGKIMQNKEKLLNKLNNFKQVKNEFTINIKSIINKMNKLIEIMEYLYKIYEDIISKEPKYKNYETFQNLKENNIDYYYETLDEINKDKDLTNKIKNIMNICDKILKKDDEIRIIYKLDNKKDKIKLFNKFFVEDNIGICNIFYEKKN